MVAKSDIFGCIENAIRNEELMIRASMHHDGYVALKKALQGPFSYRTNGVYISINRPYQKNLVKILMRKSNVDVSRCRIDNSGLIFIKR